MTCIICGEEITQETVSIEHVFPEAIGGRFKIKRVCKGCNSRLGDRVDCGLTNHPIIQLAKILRDIRNDDGTIPKPLTHAVLPDGRKVHIIYDSDGYPQDVKLVDAREVLEDGAVSYSVDGRDEKQLVGMVQKWRRRRSLPELPVEDIRQGFVTTTITAAARQEFLVDKAQHVPAMLKIAYELAWFWLGDTYLMDPMVAHLKDCFLNPVSAETWPGEHCQDLDIRFLGADDPVFQPWEQEVDSHLGLLTPLENKLIVTVRVFNLLGLSVVVSENAERYGNFDKTDSKFIANNSVTGDVRRTTLAQEIMRSMEGR